MDEIPDILPMRERRYAEIPIDEVKVINSRDRDRQQFEMNVQSIEHVGLLKPIRVNDKFHERNGVYELICGEGRLLAHRELGRTHVLAELVTCTRKEAYLQSLVENIARTNPRSMEFARELKRLHDENWSLERIAGVACKSEHYVRDLIRLVEQGEERLVHGVEQGIFPIKFAVQVSATDDAQLQNVLMDAFDEGLETTTNFAQARKLLATRARENRQNGAKRGYTVGQLKEDIAEATRTKSSYVREAKGKENRFMTLLTCLNTFWEDADLVSLLREEQLENRPELSGEFHYDTR